jgi:PGF-CTERM protein
MTPVADPEETVGSYAFTGDDEALMGLTMTPDAAVIAELADGNDTIRIEICYSATELASKGIDPSTLAIHRYDVAAAAWVKMVAGTDPCVANGITGTCAWITVNDLSTFALVGTKTAAPSGVGGGDGGTYPPEWDPTPEPDVVATAVATAEPDVVATAEAPAEPVETPTKKPGVPGFEAVFAIAGLLAVAYVLMRRRE